VFSLPLNLKGLQILIMYVAELRKKILTGCLVKNTDCDCLICVKVEELCIKCL